MTTLDNTLPLYLAQPKNLVLHKDEMAGELLNVVAFIAAFLIHM